MNETHINVALIVMKKWVNANIMKDQRYYYIIHIINQYLRKNNQSESLKNEIYSNLKNLNHWKIYQTHSRDLSNIRKSRSKHRTRPINHPRTRTYSINQNCIAHTHHNTHRLLNSAFPPPGHVTIWSRWRHFRGRRTQRLSETIRDPQGTRRITTWSAPRGLPRSGWWPFGRHLRAGGLFWFNCVV